MDATGEQIFDGAGGSPTALVVIDMLSPYDFEDADALAASAEKVVPNIAKLIERARDEGVAIIYVNDNYGDWNSSSEKLVGQAIEGAHPDLVEPILPVEGQSFVLKARHSIFFQTPLEYLLDQMGVGRLVFTGQVTEQCILYSALDAYVRNCEVVIATDAVAAIYDDLGEAALGMMERNMGAELEKAAEIGLG